MREKINQTNKPEEFNRKSMLFSGVKENEHHFYGVLYLNNEIKNGTINDKFFEGTPTFSTDEIELYYKGELLFNTIFNMLVSELNFLPSNYQKALNPYANLKVMNFNSNKKTKLPFLKLNFLDLSKTFREMSLVREVQQKYILVNEEINKINYQDIIIMLDAIQREFNDADFNESPLEMREIARKRMKGDLNKREQLLDFFYSYFSLKNSIMITFNTFYHSLIGRNMGIINEDNIINILSDFRNTIKSGKSFLLIPENFKTIPSIGIPTLITYKEQKHAIEHHEYGIPVSIIHQFKGEMGNTLKVSILIIDECLNMYSSYLS